MSEKKATPATVIESTSHISRRIIPFLLMLVIAAIAAAGTATSSSVENSYIAEDMSSSLAVMMGLTGNVSECCCSFDEIERANIEMVQPLIKKVVETPFFSHFKMDLCSTCKLWDDQPLCILRDCGVCECEEPPAWASEVDGMPLTGPDCKHVDDNVITTVHYHVESGWESAPTSFLDGLAGATDITMPDDKKDNAVVVDLRLNPEHYTGYSGPSAAKVWSAIHSSNCFQSSTGQSNGSKEHEEEDQMYCLLPAEQRLYNRFISGMHSSISLHIAQTYCLELDKNRMGECKRWGSRSDLAHERVLNHPDHVENLYVAFALLLRAVVKAGPAIKAAVPQNDPFFADSLSYWTDSLLPQLNKMASDCPQTFDESDLLVDPEFNSKKIELQRRFQHLQQIMQCVGCDRCKLWGTLQVLGVGTALRVLFHEDSATGSEDGIQLSRQEAVALVNTLERLSASLVFANDLRKDRLFTNSN